MEPTFFATQREFHDWLLRNHDKVEELEVGFYKVGSGKPSMTYREALDEALCFGWIDGVRTSMGPEAHRQRFTPRRRGSFWSPINTKRAEELITEGRMGPAGLAAFEARDKSRTERYLTDREASALDEAMLARFQADAKAWANFQAMAPSYQRVAIFWITSARQEATRQRRLVTLIEASAASRRLDNLTSPANRKPRG
jgi:uncharacterized protein YdeI (YjbR/CyaY-like superfamily)